MIKKFSIAHPEATDLKSYGKHDKTFYNFIKNSHPDHIKEIHDIYFGKPFYYKYNGEYRMYGNVMGYEATEEQLYNLFKIQEEFGIEISLTLNSLETPIELLREGNVAKKFIGYLAWFYKKGLRSCTIGSVHIMKTGILQEAFPEMRWKNTVNHRVSDAQQVMNYIFCGYDTIVLDRSLNRNLKELKNIRKAVDYYNKKYKPTKKILLSLLTTEGCLPYCPFKKEHDAIQEYIGLEYFGTLSRISCDNWRFNYPYDKLPRNAIDMVIDSKETFNDFAELVDVFKFSGRLGEYRFKEEQSENYRHGWFYENTRESTLEVVEDLILNNAPVSERVFYANSFSEILKDNVFPLSLWKCGWIVPEEVPSHYKDKLSEIKDIKNFWRTEKGHALATKLKNCRSQCWDCHACEKAFNVEPYDSALQLERS